jgi:hypothetical protein
MDQMQGHCNELTFVYLHDQHYLPLKKIKIGFIFLRIHAFTLLVFLISSNSLALLHPLQKKTFVNLIFNLKVRWNTQSSLKRIHGHHVSLWHLTNFHSLAPPPPNYKEGQQFETSYNLSLIFYHSTQHIHMIPWMGFRSLEYILFQMWLIPLHLRLMVVILHLQVIAGDSQKHT